MATNDYNTLIAKLDKFVRKYYLNKIVRGLILALAISGLWFLIVVVAEYYGRFSSALRTVLLACSLALYAIVFVTMLLYPLLQLLKIGKRMSYTEASKLLGKHFPEIGDKLQNTLELNQQLDANPEVKDLILASISQRLTKLSPIPFLSAIKLQKNLKYCIYLAPVILIFVLIISFKPAIVYEGTERIVKYNEHFEQPAPFAFNVENDSMLVKQGDDFELRLSVKGEYVPEQVKINYGGNAFYMEKINASTYKYIFKNLNNTFKFYFTAMDVESKDYEVSVLPAPIILDFKIKIEPMAYTGLAVNEINNSGDIEVPVGANVTWLFKTANLDSLALVLDSTVLPTENLKGEYTIKKQITQSCPYSLYVANEHFGELVDIKYNINVVPDLYPSIKVEEVVDSTNLSIIYFKGVIDDDYGFSRLTFFCYDGDKEVVSNPVQITQRLNLQDYYFAFDFSSLESETGKLTYYFEVADNDGFNGAKTARTQIMEFNIPTASELQQMNEQTNEETKAKIDEAKQISQDIRKSIEELKRKLVNENLSPYERSQMMQDIIDKEAELEKLVNEVKVEQEQLQQYKEQFSKSEELLKKQAEINELMENLMTDEMREMIEEMKKLMENFNKDEFFKKSEEFKMSVEEMEQNMENTLEMLKHAELEEKINHIADEMKNLSEKQEKLAEQTENKEKTSEELQKEQQALNEEFDKLKEDYKEALEKNEALKEPMSMEEFSEEMNEISQDMQQAGEELSKEKNKKASDKQKQSSQKMQDLSQKMSNMMQQAGMEQQSENMEDMRQLLENVLSFSFDQEAVMTEQQPLSARSPQYKECIIRQKNLIDNFEIIRDSLNALSGRLPMLSSVVAKDVMAIRKEFASIMDYFGSSSKYYVQRSQQTVLTSANNLALLLTEVMNQMQQQQMSQSSSSSSCNKCKNQGQGQPKKQMGQMRDIQQQLKQQMQQMMDELKKNGGQSGQNGEKNKMGEQLAKMLMQQEMMQKMLNDMMNGELSPDAAKYLKEANKMIEQNIRDLVNKNITKQTVNRQEQIITRLLQAENSQNERETEKKRESKEAKDYKLSNPDKAFEEKATEIRFNELLQMSNLRLTDYYKNRYKEYLQNLNNNK